MLGGCWWLRLSVSASCRWRLLGRHWLIGFWCFPKASFPDEADLFRLLGSSAQLDGTMCNADFLCVCVCEQQLAQTSPGSVLSLRGSSVPGSPAAAIVVRFTHRSSDILLQINVEAVICNLYPPPRPGWRTGSSATRTWRHYHKTKPSWTSRDRIWWSTSRTTATVQWRWSDLRR